MFSLKLEVLPSDEISVVGAMSCSDRAYFTLTDLSHAVARGFAS